MHLPGGMTGSFQEQAVEVYIMFPITDNFYSFEVPCDILFETYARVIKQSSLQHWWRGWQW